ncbi:hypothetical protein ACKUFS_15590 [Pseudomonas cannabina]|nr:MULTISPECIES: hypothetical protein [Pseudomonas syringae group]MBM0139992.1 hypothetical protein [Pseudomonas cannabina pv. alisalensis]QHE98636.1 hypothetical protein PMA4326_019950 [Pseudomonas syringae pv. maculicola str. ES4326]QQN20856.1 hypothetical protein JGS08_19930 [Pseudomonas cannabina pv. alisalensis]UBY99303.1 hypothetical protein LCG56_09500 [Pseudomonas cannabina pv. alisalensis]
MSIPDDWLARINDSPLEITLDACKLLTSNQQTIKAGDLLEVTVFLQAVIEAGLVPYDGDIPLIEHGKIQKAVAVAFAANVQNMIEAILERDKAMATQRALESRFKQVIKGSFGYELTDGDIDRVQQLISELRTELTREQRLDEGHKARLLKRLEALQKELHKKVSDLNHFYGLMGDFGVAIGKLGTDAKPFTDRIREIVQIGWKSQARAEQLPSSAENPMIGNDDEPPKLD